MNPFRQVPSDLFEEDQEQRATRFHSQLIWSRRALKSRAFPP